MFKESLGRLKAMASVIGLNEAELTLLSKPKRISKAILKIGGKKYKSWRILHNDSLGPGKGGIRFHPNASADEVESLAFWMSLKNSLAGLPYGGSKGGVKINAKAASKKLLEAVSRAYIDSFYKVLGQNIDIPAPDMYTNPQIMAWMLDEYEKKVHHHEPGMITGKPIELGGCQFRYSSTSLGGFVVLEEFLKDFRLAKENLTLAVQGFGNVGSNVARILQERGYKVVAVSDSHGGILDRKGLNIKAVLEAKRKQGSVQDYSTAEHITNEELLGLDVDILILAAMENQIRKDNVANVKAKNIIELANGPVAQEADAVLFKRGIAIVPDILANSGGVVGSYFEWAQNRVGQVFDPEYLKQRLVKIMKGSWQKVYHFYLSQGRKFDLRTAAYTIAVKRIIEAEKLRGHLK